MPTRRCWRRGGSAPTRLAMPRCANRSRDGRSGAGRWRAATAPAVCWRSGCWPTARMCRRAGEARARARLFDTGHNRKTDVHGAHAVAVVVVRTEGLRVLAYDDELEALRMLSHRREELTRQRVQTVNRLPRLLAELTPGKAKKDITTLQARRILASVRPRDLAGKTRRRLAVEQLSELSRCRRRSRRRPRN
jgi:hypothetical protein